MVMFYDVSTLKKNDLFDVPDCFYITFSMYVYIFEIKSDTELLYCFSLLSNLVPVQTFWKT